MESFELLLTLAVVNGVFFIGYYFGKEKGLEDGRKQGELSARLKMEKKKFFEQVDKDLSKPGGLSKN